MSHLFVFYPDEPADNRVVFKKPEKRLIEEEPSIFKSSGSKKTKISETKLGFGSDDKSKSSKKVANAKLLSFDEDDDGD